LKGRTTTDKEAQKVMKKDHAKSYDFNVELARLPRMYWTQRSAHNIGEGYSI